MLGWAHNKKAQDKVDNALDALVNDEFRQLWLELFYYGFIRAYKMKNHPSNTNLHTCYTHAYTHTRNTQGLHKASLNGIISEAIWTVTCQTGWCGSNQGLCVGNKILSGDDWNHHATCRRTNLELKRSLGWLVTILITSKNHPSSTQVFTHKHDATHMHTHTQTPRVYTKQEVSIIACTCRWLRFSFLFRSLFLYAWKQQ